MNKNKYLNSFESKSLEELLYRLVKMNTRDCLLLLLALKTGARATEILNVRKEDLDYHAKSVLIRGIKNSNDREIPLQPQLFIKLYQYAKDVQGEFVFPISYERFVQIWHNYRPVQKKLHSLRHTFAIQLYTRCKDIRLVQTALGHKSVINTQVYMTYVNTQTELRKAMYG